ncbi:MAG: protein translocase subunit SecD, partial [Acidobacteriota bacterium]
MLRAVRLKFLLLFTLTLVAIALVMPSLTGGLPSWWGKYVSHGLNLGLDLKGGMHLILQVDMDQAIRNVLTRDAADLKEKAAKQRVELRIGEFSGQGVPVTIKGEDQQAFQTLLREEYPHLESVEVSSQGEGRTFDLRLKPDEIGRLQESTMSQSLEVLRNRIDQFGVAEPVLVRQGTDNIVVQLPGIQDPQRALDLIGQTAQLEFKIVDDKANLNLTELIDKAIERGELKPSYTHEQLNRALAGKIPADDEVYIEKSVNRQTGRVENIPLLLKKKVLLTGSAISGAAERIGQFNQAYISVTFDNRGAEDFARLTGEYVKQRLAIILDDVVRSAPVIQERITAGQAQITGSFTTQEAHDLAIVLRAGSLPASIKIAQNITVGPSLGADSIRSGLISGLIGTLLVIGFMIFYYRLAGLVADYALIINVIFLLGALSLVGATLTLPGIAGIILSVGMAVDSNVLIYERMREELHIGKTIRGSIEGGYDKAFWTIIDSHVTTLITSLVLFIFGTGPIKGFAVTLSLGVVLNLFTALFGTRVVYQWLLLKHWINEIKFYQLFEKPNIDFIRLRHYAFALSGAFILLGTVAFVQLARGHGNVGVEFSGGAMVQMRASQPFTVNEVRAALNREGLGHAEIQAVKGTEELVIRLKKSEESVGQISNNLAGILNASLTGNHFEVIGKSEISASISQYLRNKALLAILISMVCIVVYIAWRFEFIFGVGAAVATFHDVLAVLGIFWLFNVEISLLVVTALLTLAGYSLTDTVVVFDRIRENMFKKRGNL